MTPSARHRDGNAAAGPLSEVFGFDITGALVQCGGCGGQASLAEAHLYAGGPGLVMRCSGCDHVLLRLVLDESTGWLDMAGVASAQFARS
jgi:hypothetical protein